MTLADRVAVFMDGRIVQVGAPREIFARPQRASVAGFIGTPPMSLLAAQWRGAYVEIDGAGSLPAPLPNPGDARAVTLGVRPGDWRIESSGLDATVELVEELGDSRIVNLRLGEQAVKLKTDRALDLREHQAVRLGCAPGTMHLFDRSSGERLNQDPPQ
jgi:multiple sugar transport system ATP-binding protein